MPSLQLFFIARLQSRSPARASCATFERAAFVFAQTTPDAGILSGLNRPLETGVDDLASAAHALCFFNLKQGGPCIADREKQFRVFV